MAQTTQKSVEFWKAFGDNTKYESTTCDSSPLNSLAADVLAYYNIPRAGATSSIGGTLDNLDIKQMDALQIISLSLFEETAIDGRGYLYEAMVNSEGDVEFVAIGAKSANITDLYYEVQNQVYEEPCAGVMVTGGRPATTRKDLIWKPIWGEQENGKVLFDSDLMFGNCNKDSFSQYATIVYHDPNLNSQYEDGIDNFYEINSGNPWDRILGHAYHIELPDGLKSKDTKVTKADSAQILIELGKHEGAASTKYGPDVNNLMKRPTFENADLDSPDCWKDRGTEPVASDGIPLEFKAPYDQFRFETERGIPVDKFRGIESIVIIGYEIEHLHSGPKDDAASNENPPKIANNQVVVSLSTKTAKAFTFKEGNDYAIAYKENDDEYKDPWIVFADNGRIADIADYGANCSFKVNPNCQYYKQHPTEAKKLQTGTIIPTGSYNGILVKEIYAKVNLDTPSITVFDPEGDKNKAYKIAEQLQYTAAALVAVEEPAPVGFNGSTIDLSEGIQDHDPTTQQDFRDTAMELALEKMSGGGMTISASYLRTQDSVNNLSETIYDFMHNDRGLVSTTYVCGPRCDPRLGGEGNSGGVINNITYSYTDSGAYTISVNEGSKMIGDMASIGGGAYRKADEEVTANGLVIQDFGNGINFKVRIDGFAERMAVNCSAAIIRVGDYVACSVHNCPIEQ